MRRAEMELDAPVEHVAGLLRQSVEGARLAELERARHREHIGVVDHGDLAEADARLGDGVRCDQADIGLARVQHFQHFRRRRLVDVDLDVGAGGGAAVERVGQHRLDHRVETSDADDRTRGAEAGEIGLRLLDLLEHALGMAHQHLAGVGEHHAVVAAVEQAGADAFLELGELLGERGLGEAELLAGLRQRRRLRHRHENAKLMQGHLGPLGAAPVEQGDRGAPGTGSI